MISRSINRTNLILLLIVFVFALLGLWIRVLPMDYLLGSSQPIVISTDPWYTVRQVEQILPNFPSYSWFDPFLSYPNGKNVDWGPVFPLLLSLAAKISGATTQEEIIRIISWVPVLLGLLLILLSYFLGKIVWDSRVGWISAILISVVGGETLVRSFYGYTDHHILEVVLTVSFFICYFVLINGLKRPIKSKKELFIKSGKLEISINEKQILLSIATGVLFYLSVMTMPTCTIIALTVFIITFFLSFFVSQKEDYLNILIVNGIIFGLFIVLFGSTGIQLAGWSFNQYTGSHLIFPIIIIIESMILYIFSLYLNKTLRWIYPILLFGFFSMLLIALYFMMPALSISFIYAGLVFLGYGGFGITIQEMQPVNISLIISNFNLLVLLAILGFFLTIKRFYLEKGLKDIAILTWIIIYLGISVLSVRYFYYGGLIVVLLSAVSLGEIYRMTQGFFNNEKKPQNRIDNKSVIKKISGHIVVGLIILFVTFFSIQTAEYVAFHDIPAQSVTDDWIESLHWLKSYSSDSELDYYAIYDKNTFSYPANVSTVLSWWNNGHWILGLTHMMPVTSPFQDQVSLVAQYLLSNSNDINEKIANKVHLKYVITTNEELFDNFPLIRQWLIQKTEKDPYYFTFYQKDQKNIRKLTPMLGLKSSFFSTAIVKLHVNDGSSVSGNGSVLVDYSPTMIQDNEVYVMKGLKLLNESVTSEFLKTEKPNQEIISLTYASPITDVPALNNYRLIYESNGTRTFPGDVTLNNIKIFERVKGYTIPGTGTIEVPIVTNQGRHFTYRQQSVNGTFTLPYSTRNSPYDVHATGPYRIIETNETFDVDESQIEKYYT